MAKLVLNNTENYEHLANVKLTKEKYPIAFENKVNELVDDGMSREDAENMVSSMVIELELYYQEGYGLFAVESDAVDNGADIFSPYNKEEYQREDSDESLNYDENQGEGFQP